MDDRMRDAYRRLPNLFFVTRQLMRSKVRSSGKSGHNSWMRLETLRYIGEHPNSTMRDIATYLRVTAPSATSLIAGLIRRKLIARERDKKDKRRLEHPDERGVLEAQCGRYPRARPHPGGLGWPPPRVVSCLVK
jgi:hypothetical protein